MEVVHAALIFKNSDPSFMVIHTKFMGLVQVSLDAVMRAYTEYSTVLHFEGNIAPPLIGAVNISFDKDRHLNKDKLPNNGTCEHPHHKGKCRNNSHDCRSLKKDSSSNPLRDAHGNIVVIPYKLMTD